MSIKIKRANVEILTFIDYPFEVIRKAIMR